MKANKSLGLSTSFVASFLVLISCSLAADADELNVETPQQVAERVFADFGAMIPDSIACQNAYYGVPETIRLPLLCKFSKRTLLINFLRSDMWPQIDLSSTVDNAILSDRWVPAAEAKLKILWPFEVKWLHLVSASDRTILCARRDDNDVDLGISASCIVQYSDEIGPKLMRTVQVSFFDFNTDLNVFLEPQVREKTQIELDIAFVAANLELAQ